MEPLAFAVIAACTPATYSVRLFDERVERVPLDLEVGLVAISISTFTAKRGYAIADAYRRRGIPVVMGGIHPSLLPAEALEHADAVCIGAAEGAWPRILEDLRSGRLSRIYDGRSEGPVGDYVPDRSIFKGKRYLALKPVQFGQGCRYSCDFCGISALYGRTLRLRDPSVAAREIAAIRSRYLLFTDDNIWMERDAFRELLDLIKPMGKRWACQASLDIAADGTLLDEMRSAGCMTAFVGFESMSGGTLSDMNKAANFRKDYAEAIESLKSRGIMVTGSFIFGYGPDDIAAIERALAFGIEEKFCLTQFNIAFPTPGTPLNERLEREGRLRYAKWWLDESYRYGQCFFRPEGIDARDLELAVDYAHERFNSIGSILSRALDRRSNAGSMENLMIFLGANLVSRREIARKKGLQPG